MSLRTQIAKELIRNTEPILEQLISAINQFDFLSGEKLIADIRELISVRAAAISTKSEEFLNDLFVINRCADLLAAYLKLWEEIIGGKFSSSWCSLQDAMDAIRPIKKFSKLDVSFFEDQLTVLENAYPYRIFASVGIIVDRFVCNICGHDIDALECPHIAGELYSGTLAVGIAQNIVSLDHVSMVENPEDKRCVVSYDDESEHFRLVRYLSNTLQTKKVRISDFRHVELSSQVISNPDYVALGRNEKCFCGSGIKFKKCCIAKTEFQRNHFRFVFSNSSGGETETGESRDFPVSPMKEQNTKEDWVKIMSPAMPILK